MEVQKLKEVSLEKMPKKHQEWALKMTEIFQRGVKEAKAENERLGITTNELTLYSSTEENLAEIPFVSESEED